LPGFPKDAVRDWLPLIARTLEEAGVPRAQAGIAARVAIACYRGLLLDALATDEREETTQALDFFLDAIEKYLTPGD
jgi:hypothetical protein